MTAGKSRADGMKLRVFLWTGLAVTALWFSACGGGSSGGSTPPPAPTTYTIGGMVTGLSGSGLVLQDNGGDNLTVTASGSFTFTTAITSGGAYAVTVLTQPSSPTQTCTVTSGTGTATANVTSVQVACAAPTFTIGGTVSGLLGTGLVLQDNGGNNLSVTANGSFTFTTALASGTAYKVTVLTQPSGPTQTCTVTNGSGTATANVTNVQVACTSETTFTIGGTVSGLTGTGLVLQDNGGNNLTVTANGSFTFSTALTSGAAYDVTVLTQPSGPAQTCTVTDGTGTATANVTAVEVACASQTASEWTWEGGSDIAAQAGTYGTQGTASSSNVPGARCCAISWTDKSGNFWLLGGDGHDSTGAGGLLNDLWKYSAGEWTWVGGANVINQAGTYGIQGTAASGNTPGARNFSMGWTDSAGNFWLFGGISTTSAATNYFNDLWEYSAGEWTWVSGSNMPNQGATYGTLGTAASANIPGSRYGAVTWQDPSGNFWLFGGEGRDSTGTVGRLGDLWRYSKGEWTWMGGSNVVNQGGTYGTEGTAASSNVPGARYGGSGWVDGAGNFWLFGGEGYDSTGTNGQLNDLWKYSGGEWTWIGGAKTGSQNGTYGTLGTPSPSNVPGGRFDAVSWTDGAGNFWLFGGNGAGSNGGDTSLNDLWEYSGGEWTWMGGADVTEQYGTYGTEGTAAPANIPGARAGAVGWVDASGNFWLFGGSGYDSVGTLNGAPLNDLWKYGP